MPYVQITEVVGGQKTTPILTDRLEIEEIGGVSKWAALDDLTKGLRQASGSRDGIITIAQNDKLAGIEAAATADQTGAEIKTAYEAEADTNAFTNALLTKLNGIEASADVNTVASVAGKTGTVTLVVSDNTDVTVGSPAAGHLLIYDNTSTVFENHIVSGDAAIDKEGVLTLTPANIVNADIHSSAGIVLSKLAVDPLARANHTGTQALSTISDSGALAPLDTVGTSQIADEAVTFAKQAHINQNEILGRITSSAGDVEVLSAANIRTIINVGSGADMVSSNNLSDVSNAGTSRTNLGVGTGNSPTFTDLTLTGTLLPTGDTAASDNAAVGYTSSEGLILTGQGSANDVTIKNDADAVVIKVLTGSTETHLMGELSIDAGVPTVQRFYRTDAHGTATIGTINFQGQDSATNFAYFGSITGYCGSNTAGAEDALMIFKVANPNFLGVNTEALRINSDGRLIAGSTLNIESRISGDDDYVTKKYFDDQVGTAAAEDIGTSGETVPMLDNANTWTLTQTMTDNIDMASGKGIDFAAASGDLLDQYDEGTWTPVLWDSSLSDESALYSTQVGLYTRIGDLCTAYCRIALSGAVDALGSLNTANGANIGGLPFTCGDAHAGGSANYCTNLNITAFEYLTCTATATHLQLKKWDSATGSSTMSISDVSDDGFLKFHITYKVA